MQPHTRALVAASAYAVVAQKKVAGLYDHAAQAQLRIAVECRGDRLQAVDGERSVTFGGDLPELYDEGDRTFVSLEVDGTTARGYDRGSQSHFQAQVADRMIQLYDYSQNAWFAFEVLMFDDRASGSTA